MKSQNSDCSGLIVYQDNHNEEVGSTLCKMTNVVNSNYDSHSLSK